MTTATPARARALLQSTIASDPNDWCIARFSLLADQIRQAGKAIAPDFALTVQDYPAEPDARAQLHTQLRQGHYGQVWLMAPDLDNGPEPDFFAALEAAVAAGTQLVIARDHHIPQHSAEHAIAAGPPEPHQLVAAPGTHHRLAAQEHLP